MKSPTPDQVRQAREAAFPGLPVPEARRKFGRLVWSTERAVRAWEDGYRAMHPAMWELASAKVSMLLGAGIGLVFDWDAPISASAATLHECDPTPESRHNDDSEPS